MKKLNLVKGVSTRNDYPYGRLKCEISFKVEFKKGKGFRFVTQTVNPKTGRINAPKKSTYSDFMYQYIGEDGHNKVYTLRFSSYESIEKLIKFLDVNTDAEFTNEESQEIWASCIACVRINAMYTRLKEGVTVDTFLNTTKVDKMIEMYGEKMDIKEITKLGYSTQEIENLINR